MQVSWIDPDEIARLAAQLEGPLRRNEPAPWDLETLPDLSKIFTLEESRLADPSDLADAIAAPVPESMEQQGATTAPGIEHIREKLRAIRDSAQDAGMLPAAAAVATSSVTDERIEPASTSAGSTPTRPAVRIPPAPQPKPEPAAQSPAALSSSLEIFTPPAGSLTVRLQSYMLWAQSVTPCEDILLVDDHGDLLWGGPARADLALSVVLAAGAGLQSGSDALTRSSVFIRSRLGEQKELSVLPCPTQFGMVTLALLNAADLSNENVARLRESLKLCIDGSGATPETG